MSSASSDQVAADKPVVPWNGWWGVLVTILFFLGGQFLAGLLIGFYAALAMGWSSEQVSDWLSGSGAAASAAFIAVFVALSLTAVWLFLRHYQASPAVLGLRRPRLSDAAYGVLAFVPYLLLLAAVVAAVQAMVPGFDAGQKQDIGFSNVAGGIELALAAVSLVVLAPLCEEIIFRGLLYGSLKKVLPLVGAALLTSLIFAAGHLLEGASGQPLYIAAIDTFILSLVLIYVRQKTGGLWASITLHALKNGVAFVSLFILHLN